MRRTKIVAAILGLGLVLASCGDDGDNAGPTGQPQLDGLPAQLDGLDTIEELEDLAESLSGSGTGTVDINGTTITFTSDQCIAFQDDLSIEGPGTTSDGDPAWVRISHTVDSRAELAEFIEEELLQQLYGDAETIVDAAIDIDYGRTELFGSGAYDQPSFSASTSVGTDDMQVEVSGSSIQGTGTAVDYNGIAGEFDATFPFSFAAGCN